MHGPLVVLRGTGGVLLGSGPAASYARGVDLALSPYDLTLLDPAAVAACVLGERVATFLPVPERLEPDDVRRALVAAPRYARLLESWRWSIPLWREGVLSSLLSGEHAEGDAAAANERVCGDPALELLRVLGHGPPDRSSSDGLDAAAADILKGGPNPGVCVPICAGLDAFAARTGAIAVRRGTGAVSGPNRTRVDSAAQAAERHLGETVAQVVLPVPTGADAALLLLARAATANERRRLSEAIEAALGGPQSDRACAARLRAGGAAFGKAMEAFSVDRSAPRGCELVWVRIVLRRVPVESAVLSALAAAARVSGRGAAKGGGGRPAVGNGKHVGTGALLRVMVVEPMKIAPSSSAARPARSGAAHVG